MHEVEADTFKEVQSEVARWAEEVKDHYGLYSIAMYTDGDNNPIAIGFYIERTADGKDETPYVLHDQSLQQLQKFLNDSEELITGCILPCTVCSYTTMGIVVRCIATERAQQRHAEEREQRLEREKQAQVQAQIDNSARAKVQKPSYKQALADARRDIEEKKLNPLQAIRRLPRRVTKTKGQKVRYDWSQLEEDYEKLNGNITFIADKMGCTTAAVRRQLKERKIGIYHNK